MNIYTKDYEVFQKALDTFYESLFFIPTDIRGIELLEVGEGALLETKTTGDTFYFPPMREDDAFTPTYRSRVLSAFTDACGCTSRAVRSMELNDLKAYSDIARKSVKNTNLTLLLDGVGEVYNILKGNKYFISNYDYFFIPTSEGGGSISDLKDAFIHSFVKGRVSPIHTFAKYRTGYNGIFLLLESNIVGTLGWQWSLVDEYDNLLAPQTMISHASVRTQEAFDDVLGDVLGEYLMEAKNMLDYHARKSNVLIESEAVVEARRAFDMWKLTELHKANTEEVVREIEEAGYTGSNFITQGELRDQLLSFVTKPGLTFEKTFTARRRLLAYDQANYKRDVTDKGDSPF
jgi:hypothetical protein